MQEDNSSSSSSNDDNSEEKGADSSDSDSKSSGFEVASNEGGNDTIKVEVDLDSLPLLELIDDETSCSDDDSSIRRKTKKQKVWMEAKVTALVTRLHRMKVMLQLETRQIRKLQGLKFNQTS